MTAEPPIPAIFLAKRFDRGVAAAYVTAAALTLIGIVFVFTLVARFLTALYSRRATAS